MKKILLLPRVKAQNANALSSPYTIGFPAMTAWLGAVHALQRQLNAREYKTLKFNSAAVVCHDMDLQTHKGRGDYVRSIVGTGNPLDKNGDRPAFIEEARCHLTVSLAIEYEGLGSTDPDDFKTAVTELLHSKMKIAGGDILEFKQPELLTVENEKDLRALTRKLMPGYALTERRDLMMDAMKEGENGEPGREAINALLDYLKINHSCQEDSSGRVKWQAKRKTQGWIVPIATGFHGISDLGTAANQRDPTILHRFVESVVTLGEFVMPYRIEKLDHMLWHYHTDMENNLYLCRQDIQTH